MEKIPFNKPVLTGKENEYIAQCLASGHLSGDGPFTRKVSQWMTSNIKVKKALTTHSGTAAIEMSALLMDLKPGDEVIMPSFTFVSTANAFVLRGAVPVFVDIRQDTLNIDETLIEQAWSNRTRGIVPIHYAGVAAEMDPILAIAATKNALVVEDNAQGIFGKYKGRPLGSLGDMSALSFHETKNIVCGEGGALLIQKESLMGRAEILREKGSNRASFYRGEINRYEWMDVGSSYLPSDILCAFLWAQLEQAESLQARRMKLWNFYYKALEGLEKNEKIRRPIVPANCEHNGHIFYILLQTTEKRDKVLSALKEAGIYTTFHYVPLHSAPAGKKFGRTASKMNWTDSLSSRLLRLPMWIDTDKASRVVESLEKIVGTV